MPLPILSLLARGQHPRRRRPGNVTFERERGPILRPKATAKPVAATRRFTPTRTAGEKPISGVVLPLSATDLSANKPRMVRHHQGRQAHSPPKGWRTSDGRVPAISPFW